MGYHGDMNPRIAAIDVGTNSIRLIVAELDEHGGYRLLDDEKELARLGAGMSRTGRMADDAIARAATAIQRMVGIAEGYNVDRLVVIGTCAVREAENGRAFVDLVREQAGVDLEVISSEQEARYAHRSVVHAFDIRDIRWAVADIGGGSTELVTCSGPVIEQIHPTPLGAVRLTEAFPGDDIASFDRLREFIRNVLDDLVPKPEGPLQLLIGTGGTFTSMASMMMQRTTEVGSGEAFADQSVRGYEMHHSDVHHMLLRLRNLTVRERRRLPGLNPDRAEIIVAGVAIVDAIMARLKINTLRVHDRGIRDGVLLSVIDEMRPGPRPRSGAEPLDRLRAVRRFAESCRYERAHSEHVAKLALGLFDQLAAITDDPGRSWSSPQHRELLEAAAVLHDVGYAINYAKHHKHSYHMIMHSELPGFTHRERAVIANVARYHRRARPKKKHGNFARLDPADQMAVRRLAGVLRVADGLDRTHTQDIVDLRLRPKGKTTLGLEVCTKSRPDVNLWGAARKRKLFQKAFRRRLEISDGGGPAV